MRERRDPARPPVGTRTARRILPRVEALLFAVGMIALIVGGLYLFARAWPRDDDAPTVGGYRALHRSDGNGRPNPDTRVHEDDDAQWHWQSGEPPDK